MNKLSDIIKTMVNELDEANAFKLQEPNSLRLARIGAEARRKALEIIAKKKQEKNPDDYYDNGDDTKLRRREMGESVDTSNSDESAYDIIKRRFSLLKEGAGGADMSLFSKSKKDKIVANDPKKKDTRSFKLFPKDEQAKVVTLKNSFDLSDILKSRIESLFEEDEVHPFGKKRKGGDEGKPSVTQAIVQKVLDPEDKEAESIPKANRHMKMIPHPETMESREMVLKGHELPFHVEDHKEFVDTIRRDHKGEFLDLSGNHFSIHHSGITLHGKFSGKGKRKYTPAPRS